MYKSHMNRYVIAFILTAVVFLVYFKALGNGFVYDDRLQIIENTWIRDISRLPDIFTSSSFAFLMDKRPGRSYRPLVISAFMVEYALFGLKPWGWHLVNIILHAANTLLVFSILSFLLSRRGDKGLGSTMSEYLPPFFGALVFATHPVNSEPVSWVGCVPEFLFTLLCLASFYLYMISAGAERNAGTCSRKGARGLSALLFFFSLLAKETAFSLPFILFAYDYSMEGRRVFKDLKRYAPYAMAALLYLAARVYALGGAVPAENMYPYLSGPQYLINGVVLFVKYLRVLVLPVGDAPLQMLDPVFSISEPRALVSMVFALLLFLLVYLFRKRVHPLYILAFSIAVLPLLPALYIPGISRHSFSHRYLYFPSIGFGLFLSLVARRFLVQGTGRKGAAVLVMAVMVALYSFSSVKRTSLWKDEISLWSASLEGSPGNYYAQYMIGYALQEKGMYGEAASRFSETIRITTSNPYPDPWVLGNARLGLAESYHRSGRPDEAIREYTEFLKTHPDYAAANYQLGYLYQEKGRLDLAITYYKRSIGLFKDPADLRDAYANMGNCYLEKGMYAEAESSYMEALRTFPDDPGVLNNLLVLRKRAAGAR